jgi:hypothetical protein
MGSIDPRGIIGARMLNRTALGRCVLHGAAYVAEETRRWLEIYCVGKRDHIDLLALENAKADTLALQRPGKTGHQSRGGAPEGGLIERIRNVAQQASLLPDQRLRIDKRLRLARRLRTRRGPCTIGGAGGRGNRTSGQIYQRGRL